MSFLGEKRWNRVRGGIILAVLVAFGVSSIGVASATASEADTIGSLLNQSRVSAGLAPLKRNAAMDGVALRWAQQMSSNRLMSHNPSYGSEIPGGWSRAGENVATNFPSPTAMNTGWMNSPPHRANILGDFTDVGIAYFVDGNGVSWGVEDFGRYGTTAAAPVPVSKPALVAKPIARPAPVAKPAPAPVVKSAPASTSARASAAPPTPVDAAPAAAIPTAATPTAASLPANPPTFIPIPAAKQTARAVASHLPKRGFRARAADSSSVSPALRLAKSSGAIPSNTLVSVMLAIVLLGILALVIRIGVTLRRRRRTG